MNLKDIRRHLSPLLATPKGRMKRPRGQIRGTRKSGHEAEAEEAIAFEEDMHPRGENTTSQGVNVVGNVFFLQR